MISKILHNLGRAFKRLGQLILCIIIVYPLLVIWARYSADAYLPNGAILNRNIDLDNWTRIDLSRHYRGKLIAKDVERLCWNDSAVWGVGASGGFIWLGGDHVVIYGNDPRYMETVRKSGLLHPEGGCNGYYRDYMGPELLVRGWCPVKPDSRDYQRDRRVERCFVFLRARNRRGSPDATKTAPIQN